MSTRFWAHDLSGAKNWQLLHCDWAWMCVAMTSLMRWHIFTSTSRSSYLDPPSLLAAGLPLILSCLCPTFTMMLRSSTKSIKTGHWKHTVVVKEGCINIAWVRKSLGTTQWVGTGMSRASFYSLIPLSKNCDWECCLPDQLDSRWGSWPI